MNTDKLEANKTQAFTTLKEYDARVRLSQRKLKALNERSAAGESVSQELELAQAAHKFLLASRAVFKAQSFGDRHPPTGLKLRPAQEQALEEARKSTGLKVDPVIFEGQKTHIGITRIDHKPTAAEPQPLLARDRAREFVPSARVIRERAHAGAMALQPRYAPDDSRCQGLGYKVTQRRAESKRRVMVLGVTPKFPSERYLTQRMGSGSARITVNGLTW